MLRAACLVVFLIAAASSAAALPFDVSRVAAAQADEQGELASPRFDIKPPWGLWANRAPYPYYDGPFSIDVQDDLVARDIWFDFSGEFWAGVGYRGASGQWRARFGLVFADVSYTQLARSSSDDYQFSRIEDWAYITDARGHLGFTAPLPHVGYLDFGIGVAGFDETRGISRMGLSFKASASIWPIWPIGLEGWAVREQFFDGTGANDFGARLHVQVFRHLHLTAGWRWMNVDGSNFSTHGFTFGLSFQWSNLRTFFWAPFNGPAY
jgi:hypothetical protein